MGTTLGWAGPRGDLLPHATVLRRYPSAQFRLGVKEIRKQLGLTARKGWLRLSVLQPGGEALLELASEDEVPRKRLRLSHPLKAPAASPAKRRHGEDGVAEDNGGGAQSSDGNGGGADGSGSDGDGSDSRSSGDVVVTEVDSDGEADSGAGPLRSSDADGKAAPSSDSDEGHDDEGERASGDDEGGVSGGQGGAGAATAGGRARSCFVVCWRNSQLRPTVEALKAAFPSQYAVLRPGAGGSGGRVGSGSGRDTAPGHVPDEADVTIDYVDPKDGQRRSHLAKLKRYTAYNFSINGVGIAARAAGGGIRLQLVVQPGRNPLLRGLPKGDDRREEKEEEGNKGMKEPGQAARGALGSPTAKGRQLQGAAASGSPHGRRRDGDGASTPDALGDEVPPAAVPAAQQPAPFTLRVLTGRLVGSHAISSCFPQQSLKAKETGHNQPAVLYASKPGSGRLEAYGVSVAHYRNNPLYLSSVTTLLRDLGVTGSGRQLQLHMLPPERGGGGGGTGAAAARVLVEVLPEGAGEAHGGAPRDTASSPIGAERHKVGRAGGEGDYEEDVPLAQRLAPRPEQQSRSQAAAGGAGGSGSGAGGAPHVCAAVVKLEHEGGRAGAAAARFATAEGPGAFCATDAPGQVRVCGLTFDAALAPAVASAQTAWLAWLGRELRDADPTKVQLSFAASNVDKRLSRAVVCNKLARLLGLEGDDGCPDAQLPEGPVVLEGALEPCGDPARGGAGLKAKRDIRPNEVLGVVGGYVMPAADAAVFRSAGFRHCQPDVAARLAGVVEGTQADVAAAWQLLAGSFRMPLPVIPICVRGLVLPVLVTVCSVSAEQQLLRDYGADWWLELESAWEVAEHSGLAPGRLLHDTHSRGAGEGLDTADATAATSGQHLDAFAGDSPPPPDPAGHGVAGYSTGDETALGLPWPQPLAGTIEPAYRTDAPPEEQASFYTGALPQLGAPDAGRATGPELPGRDPTGRAGVLRDAAQALDGTGSVLGSGSGWQRGASDVPHSDGGGGGCAASQPRSRKRSHSRSRSGDSAQRNRSVEHRGAEGHTKRQCSSHGRPGAGHSADGRCREEEIRADRRNGGVQPAAGTAAAGAAAASFQTWHASSLAAALGEGLRLHEAVQEQLAKPLGFLGKAAVVAAQQLLQRHGLPYAKGVVLRVTCAPVPGIKLRLGHDGRGAPSSWGDVAVRPQFGELVDNLDSADEEAKQAMTSWVYSLNTFAPSVVLQLEPASLGPAVAAAEVAARLQRGGGGGAGGGVAVPLHAGVEAMFDRARSR
ncbi:hypothetical protein GPECTOR_30g167 [Gonium pectorale]|uniref:Uncharacterized protein n=1 Tax=Gonium pectorale TaxID=33097 RepID=A0A150GE06_GONPE|nr:hypothetical protein GPECTOR_30g167 [Gonium pectorale]|eukprot:KXZ48072.1 hypothetical protein GPECTOR_30g167 [Gonium pectorale]